MTKRCFYLESYLSGGLDTFTIDLLNNWPDKSEKLTLICNDTHEAVNLYNKKLKSNNITFETHNIILLNNIMCNFKILNKLYFKPFIFILNYSLIFYYIITLNSKLKLNRFDSLMIINGGYPAGPSCRAIGISWGIYQNKKSVHNFHNFATPTNKINNILEFILDKLLIIYTSTFVSVSNICSKSLLKRSAFNQFTSIKVIYNGINNNFIDVRTNIREELLLNKNTKICLMLATYEERKGHEFLFNCFNIIQNSIDNVILICCGSGLNHFKHKIDDFLSNFNFKNNVYIFNYREDAIEILSQSDLLLITSQDFESFGLTAVEAMKYKIPIVTTNTGGLSEVVINNFGGFLFQKNDLNGFSNMAISLLTNNELAIEQGNLGFKLFTTKFQITRTSLEYYNLIKFLK